MTGKQYCFIQLNKEVGSLYADKQEGRGCGPQLDQRDRCRWSFRNSLCREQSPGCKYLGGIAYGGYFLHTLSPSTQGQEGKAWTFLSKPHSGRRQWKRGLLVHFFMSLKSWGPWRDRDDVSSMHSFTQKLQHSGILLLPTSRQGTTGNTWLWKERISLSQGWGPSLIVQCRMVSFETRYTLPPKTDSVSRTSSHVLLSGSCKEDPRRAGLGNLFIWG